MITYIAFLRAINVGGRNTLNPFGTVQPGADVMMFVTFLAHDPEIKPKLPLESANERLEVFQITDRAAFILAHRKKNGWFGFPITLLRSSLV